ncbi:MAG: endonuclease/exonuclease/phosphatase family protein [bacterium]
MKRLALVLAATLLTCGAFAENITVATMNVWSGLSYQGVFAVDEYEDRATRAFRFNLLANGFADLQPDVIALQEANPLPSYAERIAGELSYDAVHDVRQAGVRIGPVGLPWNLREGEIILAGRDRGLEYAGAKQLAGPRAGNVAAFQFGAGSQVLGAQITAEGRTVHVFTTRWTPSPQADTDRLVQLVGQYEDGEITGDELTRLMEEAVEGSERRKREARETVVFINEQAGEEPVILMGSLHVPPDSEEIQILRDAGFVDAWAVAGRGAGYTYDATTNANIAEHDLATFPGQRVRYDYIFVRGTGIAVRNATVIFGRPTYGVHPSDHYGLYAELRVDP